MARLKQKNTSKREAHERRIAGLAAQISDFTQAGVPFRIYHGNTNSTRTLSFDRRTTVDTSQLDNVLAVDPVAKTALVESNVPMDVLVRATLRFGLVPPVVPEFPGITVGGAIQGGAGESSSFKWGGVNSIVNWCEVVLADGTIIRASPFEHADLFWGMAGSYGTLGVITAAEIKLVPAKKYVTVTYTPVHGYEATIKLIRKAVNTGCDFVDGIIFARDAAVIVTGYMNDRPTGAIRRFRGLHDDWFYLHAQKQSNHHEPVTETIPLMDYLFRYDRGAFWMGKYAFDMFGLRFTHVNRLLLNGLFNTRRMYQALQASGAARQFIIQDVALPADKTLQFLEYVDNTFNIYPLWLCPLVVDNQSPLHANYLPSKSVINVGVWGPFHGGHAAFVAANKDFEHVINRLGGRKWLYAHTYYLLEEFWSIYNKNWYDNLRTAYKAGTLPSVYDKVHVHEKPLPISRRRGILRAIVGRRAVKVK